MSNFRLCARFVCDCLKLTIGFTVGFRLEASAVVAGRLAEVLGAVAAEIGERGEVHPVGYLRERQVLVVEVFLQDGNRGAVDEAADAVSGDALDGGGEVFCGNV